MLQIKKIWKNTYLFFLLFLIFSNVARHYVGPFYVNAREYPKGKMRVFLILINLFLATPHSVQDLSSELSPSAVGAQSPSHWAAREVPTTFLFQKNNRVNLFETFKEKRQKTTVFSVVGRYFFKKIF